MTVDFCHEGDDVAAEKKSTFDRRCLEMEGYGNNESTVVWMLNLASSFRLPQVYLRSTNSAQPARKSSSGSGSSPVEEFDQGCSIEEGEMRIPGSRS